MARNSGQYGGSQYQDPVALDSVSTKVRINEQNIMNLHNKIQLLSRNFLDFKKEIRDKVGAGAGKDIGKLAEEVNKKLKETENKIEFLEKKIKESSGSSAIPKKEMTTEDADKILDDILKKTGEK